MNKTNYPLIKETVYYEQLDNGLEVYLLPKVDFLTTFGLFATRFGSIDNQFIPANASEYIQVNDGIAHFLEHKMFEKEDYDVLDKFSELGASCNAFTNFDKTAYLFSTTSNVIENTHLLLDFVQDLELTDASVEKEKGIIVSEIKMYEDDADMRLYFGLISNMYHNLPLNIDIGGTKDSVLRITKQELELCYEAFYHPSNMTLFICGDIDPDKLMQEIKSNQSQKHFSKEYHVKTKKIIEPTTVKITHKTDKMDVYENKAGLAIKVNERLLPGIKQDLALNLLLDIYFSKSSSFYETMLNQHIINDGFNASYSQDRDYGFISFTTECQNPDLFIKAIKDQIELIKQDKIDEKLFVSHKRSNYGQFVSIFDSNETIAVTFIDYHFNNNDLFNVLEILQSITLEDLEKMKQLLDKQFMTTYIIEPYNM